MRRNRTVWVVSCLIFAPLAWLVWTTPAEYEREDLLMLAGALATGLALLNLLWRGQARGRWLAHRCMTCEQPMRQIMPGELRPPSGRAQHQVPRWRCSRCGRLE